MRKVRILVGLVIGTLILGFGLRILGDSLTAPATGTWVAAGAMNTARSEAAAAFLPDGRLLITGGSNGSGPVAECEFFNPDGSFSPAPPMSFARAGHTATLLPDGRVLVAGGTDATGAATQTAELFDSSANSWSSAGPLMVGRSGHTATLLESGQVLIAGGTASGAALASLELFDSNSNTFSLAAGTLSSPRENHAAAVLADGRVLIVGGWDGTTNAPQPPATTGSPNVLASSDIYDPMTGAVEPGPALNFPRESMTATAENDGAVAVIGGSNGQDDLASIEVLDPSVGVFVPAGAQLTTARQGHLGFLLPHNGGILIVGGTSAGAAVASAELYTPWTGAISPTGPMSIERAASTGAALSNGTVASQNDGILVVAGGTDAGGNSLASAEAYGFAWVKTDAADYPPGTTVNITGGGWQPGETVIISLVESPLIDTHGPYSVTADINGNISDSSFTTDDHDVNVAFTLTAVGSVSQAEARFTDAPPPSVTITSPTNASPVTLTSLPDTVTVNFSWTNWPVSTPPDHITFTASICTNASCGTVIASNSTSMASPTGAGSHSLSITVPSGTANGSYTVVLEGSDGTSDKKDSQNNAVVVNVPACTPAAVTTNPTNQSVVVGQTATFTAAGSGTPSPTVQWQVSTNSGATWNNIGAATSTTLNITPTDSTFNGNQYRAVFTNTCSGTQTATTTAATLTVGKANTTTTITTNLTAHTVVGESYDVAFTVTVNSPGSGTPTGTVTVSDGSQTCTASVATGHCSVTSTTPGAKTVTASYPGDTNFNSSTSSGTAHTVDKADTTTTITNSTDLATATVVGQSYTVKWSVTVNTPGSGTPTGTVTISGGSGCSAAVSDGQCDVTSTDAGPKTLTASYGGDTNFNTSTSTGVSHQVNKADTSTAVSLITGANPSVYGQPLTFQAAVTVVAPGGGTPTGNVTFYDGGTCLSPGTVLQAATALDGSAHVSLSTSSLPVAGSPHTVLACYAGSSNYNASGGSVAQTVNKADTTTAVTSSPTVAFGTTSVTLSATVGANSPSTATVNEGTVTFTIKDSTGTTTIDSVPGVAVSAGGASTLYNITTPTLYAAGSYRIYAAYVPAISSPNFNSSSSSGYGTLTINKASTVTAVSVSPGTQQYSDLVTFTASVTPDNILGISPATAVTFKIGNTVMGSVDCTAQTANATCAVSSGTLVFTLSDVALLEPTNPAPGNPPNGDLAPGTPTVTAAFSNVNANFTVLNATNTMTITAENARVAYSGLTYFGFPAGTTSGPITLSATVWDISNSLFGPSGSNDAAYDTHPGDIRNATVKFVNRDAGDAVLCGPINVGLVSPSDTTTGSVSCTTGNLPVGGSINVGIVVSDYYTRNSGDDDTTVNLTAEGTGSIGGGGYLVLTSAAAGSLLPTPGLKNNFGFTVQYNKKGTNLQGSINTIVRSALGMNGQPCSNTRPGFNTCVYQVKGNALSSLTVNVVGNPTVNNPSTATFVGKASIQDVTDPNNVTPIDGGVSFVVQMTDAGSPGKNDMVSFQVTKGGTTYYISNFVAGKVVQQVISGGNLSVH